MSNYTLWGKKSSIIIEPICTLRVEHFAIVDWKLIDEWGDDLFNVNNIRNRMESELSLADGSDIEQILYPPMAENIYALGDNQIMYPNERLSKFVTEIVPNEPKIADFVDGICHFHPTGDVHFSDLDMHALEEFARVMHEYGKKCIIGLIIVKDNPHEYIEKSNMSLDHFVEYMVSDLKSTSFSARIFYPKKTGEHIDVSVI